jgi:hypothetical protein
MATRHAQFPPNLDLGNPLTHHIGYSDDSPREFRCLRSARSRFPQRQTTMTLEFGTDQRPRYRASHQSPRQNCGPVYSPHRGHCNSRDFESIGTAERRSPCCGQLSSKNSTRVNCGSCSTRAGQGTAAGAIIAVDDTSTCIDVQRFHPIRV